MSKAVVGNVLQRVVRSCEIDSRFWEIFYYIRYFPAVSILAFETCQDIVWICNAAFKAVAADELNCTQKKSKQPKLRSQSGHLV